MIGSQCVAITERESRWKSQAESFFGRAATGISGDGGREIQRRGHRLRQVDADAQAESPGRLAPHDQQRIELPQAATAMIGQARREDRRAPGLAANLDEVRRFQLRRRRVATVA